MDGSIDGTGSMWHPCRMELDPETERLLADAKPAIERELYDALPLGRNEPACVGVVLADGKIGVAKATTRAGYRQAPEPTDNLPERALWEAVGAALRLPLKPGWEHVVLAEHRTESTVVTVRILSIQTDVRSRVQRLLGDAKTPDERMAVNACETLPQPEVAGPTLQDCVEQVDAQLRAFNRVLTEMQDEARRQNARPTAQGREVLRWWLDQSRRPIETMRQYALLTMMLRAGLVTDAEWLQNFAETMRAVVLPPPTTPRNTEVLAMSTSIILDAAAAGSSVAEPDQFLARTSAVVHLMEVAHRLQDQAGLVRRTDIVLIRFLTDWIDSAFARLEVSHKLAAALCLTDVPDDTELHAPWIGWSLVVPDGLLGASQPARLWCLGLDPAYVVTAAGQVEPWSNEIVGGETAADLLRAFVRAVCVVLSDPDRRKAEGKWGSGASTPTRSKRPPGPPPKEGARYLLAQPVTIDLRDTVREILGGRKGGGGIPKHQFLVRGHPRQQAWGPKHSLRRYKWIEPFWKGDPEARILLRGHKVEDD
jgi:hypothetical protein